MPLSAYRVLFRGVVSLSLWLELKTSKLANAEKRVKFLRHEKGIKKSSKRVGGGSLLRKGLLIIKVFINSVALNKKLV